MKKPKMALFDYGYTLLCEPGFDFLHGEEALFMYVKSPSCLISVNIAVAKAIDEVKTAADYVCDANDNDGAAKWLEENVL